MSLTFLPLEDINFAVPLSCRFQRNPAHARRVAEVPAAALPPVVVFEEVHADGQSHYWLADGGYRYAVAERQDRPAIQADVRPGNLADAVVYACQANERHGVPRTHADKRAAVMRLLGNPLFFGKSDVWISEQCKVSDRFVAKLRQRTGQSSPERMGRDGKSRRLPTHAAGPAPRSSRDQALAEIARAKGDIDEAIELVQQASASEGAPMADILRQLARAREEVLVWERELEGSPPEPPVPDPNDHSPNGRWAAEEYRIRRMSPEDLLGMMETVMKRSNGKHPLWKDEFDDDDDGLQEDLEEGFEELDRLGERPTEGSKAGPEAADTPEEGPEEIARLVARWRGSDPPPLAALRSDNPVRPLPWGMRSLDPRQMEADFNAKFAWLYRTTPRTPPAADAAPGGQPRTTRAEVEPLEGERSAG